MRFPRAGGGAGTVPNGEVRKSSEIAEIAALALVLVLLAIWGWTTGPEDDVPHPSPSPSAAVISRLLWPWQLSPLMSLAGTLCVFDVLVEP